MILLVGASVRALMESAVESGHEVIGIDFFSDIDTRWQGKTINLSEDYGLKPTIKHVLEVAKTISCDGLVYASGPENTTKELNYWERKGLLRGNGISTLTKVRNPWKLHQSLGKIGVKMPRFCSVGEWKYHEDVKRWLLKPLNRGGGHGIVELSKKKEDVLDLLSGLSRPACFIVQEYIDGIPGSVTFLANGRKAVVLGTSRQLISENIFRPFLYEGNIVPLDIHTVMNPLDFEKQITTICEHLSKDFSVIGINTVDFIINEEGIWILELNPRWSASVELIEKSLGKRLFAYHLAACKGMELTQNIQQCKPPNKFWGKRIVYAPAPSIIENLTMAQLRRLYEEGVRDIPSMGTIIPKGQPLCTVLAEGVTDQNCNMRLKIKTEWIQRFFGETGVRVAR